jgi:pilus assembly protein Flp/PilA
VSRIERIRRAASDRGATSTEYALLVVFIAIAIVLGVTAFGQSLSGIFNQLASTLASYLP